MPKKQNHMGNGWGELSQKHKDMRKKLVDLNNLLDLFSQKEFAEHLNELKINGDQHMPMFDKMHSMCNIARDLIGIPWDESQKPGGLRYHKDSDEISVIPMSG